MTVVGGQRPELRAHSQAVRLEMPVLVKELRDLLGAKLVAYLGEVGETRAVRQWADGVRKVKDPLVADRLRVAYQVAAMLAERDSAEVVQAWFQGLNPHLDDRSPAWLLREGELEAAGGEVLAAARAFAANG